MASSVYSRTFQKASEISGGQKKLARQLRVPIKDLESWIADAATPPMAVFLKAVDLVLDDTRTSSSSSEPLDPPAPQDCAPTSSHFAP